MKKQLNLKCHQEGFLCWEAMDMDVVYERKEWRMEGGRKGLSA